MNVSSSSQRCRGCSVVTNPHSPNARSLRRLLTHPLDVEITYSHDSLIRTCVLYG